MKNNLDSFPKNQKTLSQICSIFKKILLVFLAIILCVFAVFLDLLFINFSEYTLAWKIMLGFLLVWSTIILFIYNKKPGLFMVVGAWLLFFGTITYTLIIF